MPNTWLKSACSRLMRSLTCMVETNREMLSMTSPSLVCWLSTLVAAISEFVA